MTTPLGGDESGVTTTTPGANSGGASDAAAALPGLLHVLVMSDAGKPIFSYRQHDRNDHDGGGDVDDLARMCGLVQAVRTSLLYSSSGGGGGVDLQSLLQSSSSCCSSNKNSSSSIQTTTRTVVFTVESITLVAILSYKSNSTSHGTLIVTDFSLRLLLEYVYAQIIFALTDQVQSLLLRNASLNVESLLSPSASTLRSLLQHKHQDPAPFVLASVPTVFPLSPAVREQASVVLQQAGDATPNTVFALLLQINHINIKTGNPDADADADAASDAQLIALVQPSFRPHQLTAVDLHLLMHFLAHQQQHHSGVNDSYCELWFPVCLPRFHSTGFLHCFTHSLASMSSSNATTHHRHHSLLLALISQDRSTEQFQLFRAAAAQIRQRLGIPQTTETVLQIHSSLTAPTSTATNTATGSGEEVRNLPQRQGQDVSWSRTALADGGDQQQFNSMGDHDDDGDCSSSHHNQQQQHIDDDDYEIVAHPDDCSSSTVISSSTPESCRLLEELREIQKDHDSDVVRCRVPSDLGYFMSDDGLEHFAFRIDVPIHHCHETTKRSPSKQRNQYEEPGVLSQCLSKSIGNDGNRTNTWNIYQKLSLRLRLGSASDEMVARALDTMTIVEQTDEATASSVSNPSISKHCSAMRLVEESPRIQGVAYVTTDDKTYLAMNGQGFELYIVAASSLSVQQIAAMGAKLVRRLIAEEDILFLSRPLTWSN